LTGCSTTVKPTNITSPSSAITSKQPESPDASVGAEISPHDIAADLAKEFAVAYNDNPGFGKRLEDAYNANPSDPELTAMYHYHNAKVWDYGDDSTSSDIAQSKNEISKIPSDYSGVMSDEISAYAIKLFGSIAEWSGEAEQKQERTADLTASKKSEIISWINSEYEFYESFDEEAYGDKYTDTIFNEAAEKYGLSRGEIDEIWIGQYF
jgi:hypothetical protein